MVSPGSGIPRLSTPTSAKTARYPKLLSRVSKIAAVTGAITKV
jgi:hypothetical protein